MKPQSAQTTKVLCIALFLLGIAAAAFTVSVNAIYGHSLGTSESGQNGFSVMSAIVDMSAVAFAMVVGLLWRGRQYTAASFVGIMTLFLAALTFSSIFGWGAAERITKSRAADMQVESAKAKADAENKLALARSQQQIEWLRATVVDSTSKAERERMSKELKAELDKPITIKVPDVSTVYYDAQAMIYAHMFGVSPDDVKVAWIMAFSAALILIKITAGALATALWPLPVDASQELTLQAIASALPANDTIPRTKSAERAAIVTDKRQRQQMDDVQRFIAEATRPDPQARVKANEVHNWYQAWAQKKGMPVMTQAAFGRMVTILKIDREETARHTFYRGLARVDDKATRLKVVA